MKVSEIKEKLSSGVKIEDLGITPIKYLPHARKVLICEDIADKSITQENGITICDHFRKEQAIDLYFLMEYADLEFDCDDAYDFLKESSVYKYVVDNIPESERLFIYEGVYDLIEQKLRIENSIEGILARNLTRLIDFLEKNYDKKSINKLVKDFKGISSDKIPFVMDLYNTIEGKGKVETK
jgi:hypothetical protein